MKLEIKKRSEGTVIKESLYQNQEDDSISGNSLDIIINQTNKKVKISDSTNSFNNNINNNSKFKKLGGIEEDEIPLESKNIAYPANFFSSLTFNWIYKIIKNRTEDNPVKLSSLDEISPEVQSKQIYEEIRINWYGKYEKKAKSKSTGYPLFMTLLITNKKKIIISFILFFIRFISELFNVLAFKEIITYFNINKKRHKTLLLNFNLAQLIIIMLINKFTALITSRQIVFYVETLGKISTVQLNCLIYDKLLKIACYNKGNFNEGQIVNLVQADSEKFGIFISSSPEVIILPFKLIYSVSILFSFFRESFIIGFFLLILMIYLFFIFGFKEKKYQRQMMKAADIRMNLTTQIFNIIKTIKLYVWEKVFLNKIKEKRDVELDYMKNKLRMQIWSNFTYWIADVVLYSVSIIFYNIIHHQMDTTKIITGIYIVNDLVIPMFNLPHFIRFYFETIISLVRIETFLSYKENDEKQIKYLSQESEYAIIIENVDFGGETKSNINENVIKENIDNINEFKNNKKEEENATLKLNQNDSINTMLPKKDINANKNINEKNNQEKKIIITLLKNINFKIKKGEHICIIGEVGSGKICLLNAIINNLLVLNKKKAEGNIQLSGKVSFVSQNSWILNDTIEQNILFFKKMNKEKYSKILSICQLKQDFYQEFKMSKENKRKESVDKKENLNEIVNIENNLSEKNFQIIKKDDVIYLNEKDGEKISFKLFMTFIAYSGGIIYLIQLALCNIIWQVSQIYREYYLAMWSSHKNITNHENNKKMIYFVLMTIPGIIAVYYRQYYMVKGYLNYNIKMHDSLIKNLINAPINLFHDIIPRGNILNRLSKELNNSNILSLAVSGTLRVMFQLSGAIIVCTLFNIWTLPLIIFLICIELYITKFCFYATQDIHKLVSNYRAPIFGVFGETLSGLPIIRAFNYEKNFTNKFYKKMNNYLKANIYQKGIIGWYGIHLDIVSFTLLSFILAFAYFMKEKYLPQSIGLLLTYSIKMIFYMYDAFKRFSFLTELLISLERCDTYTKVIQEKPRETDEDKNLYLIQNNESNTKFKSFISKGKINFENYSVRYRPDTPLILKNITLEIKPGEKIGVVGQTGSGKSTLLLCLLRILEASEGKIYIDDIDISQIGLELLRHSLTIIPQEPILLEGNIRDNIDPSRLYSDSEILLILNEVGLGDFMLGKSLDYKIEENGGNISVGEKQLICVARALLKKTKIILMDEATANIDYKTEEILKRNINEDTKGCTVITIAHRIKTVINYDKILVLKDGEIDAFDTPDNLIKSKGLFYQLYKESLA